MAGAIWPFPALHVAFARWIVAAGIAAATLQKDQATGDQGLSIRQSTGEKAGRWGAGLTAAKMSECRWLKPELVGQFEFAEWTSDNHLRHSRFIALRDDKKPKSVVREK